MKKMVQAFGATLAMLLMAGCQNRIVDYTVISTKNVDLSRASSFQRGSARVVGEDIAHIVVLFPTSVPNMKEAIDRAIESTPGAVALTDGVVYQRSFYIPLIYGQSGFKVEGLPLIDPALHGGSPR
jgi:hypothetical protein